MKMSKILQFLTAELSHLTEKRSDFFNTLADFLLDAGFYITKEQIFCCKEKLDQ